MNKTLRSDTGFSIVEGVVLMVVIVCLSLGGWLIYKHHQRAANGSPQLSSSVNTSGWHAYTNDCFKYSFKAPTDLTVKILDKPSFTSCGLVPRDIGSQGVNDWALVSASIGSSYVESLPKGPYLDVSTPIPVDDPIATQFIGLHPSSSAPSMLHAIVSSADKASKASLVTINGHEAAVVQTISPNKQPNNFNAVDTPYCPCTSKEVIIDTGSGSVLRISATRLNSDQQASRIIDAVVSSFIFQ